MFPAFAYTFGNNEDLISMAGDLFKWAKSGQGY